MKFGIVEDDIGGIDYKEVRVGQWIMLTKKLPTVVSPPKLSLHYSVPWEIDLQTIKKLWKTHCFHALSPKKKTIDEMLQDLQSLDDVLPTSIFGGAEPNEAKARGIFWVGEKIKVWPHEYSVIPPERWPDYYPDVYELIFDDELKDLFTVFPVGEDSRVYEAALLDGCNDFQALLTAIGQDIDDSPTPVGWFRIKPEYGLMFASERELQEDV